MPPSDTLMECAVTNQHISSTASQEASCNEPLSDSSRVARSGDIITLTNLQFLPEHGFVPEPLFDTIHDHEVALVLDGGHYLPGLHALLHGCRVGDVVTDVSIDAGWGARRPDWVVRVPRSRLPARSEEAWAVGQTLRWKGGIDVMIVEVQGEFVVVDANPPLAGTSYACSFTVVGIADKPDAFSLANDREVDVSDAQYSSRYQMATFALGCFWGAELAFMRTEGVVGTRVGYSQGKTNVPPTYEEVSKGHTGHRESVQVIYDSHIVSYEALVHVALSRLEATQGYNSVYDLQRLHRLRNDTAYDDDETKQYRSGFYFHSIEQRDEINRILEQEGDAAVRLDIEVLEASTFWDAEEEHQQYLYKGGQSSRKGAKEPIRCYG